MGKDIMTFPEFYLHRYRFTFNFLEGVSLPEYKGSALRGFFGNALKSLLCVIKKTDCSNCLLKDKCVYVYLFESGKEADNKPLPYILIPPLDAGRRINAGEDFSFEMTLIGRANDYFPHIAAAFLERGRKGFKNSKGKFVLKNIEAIDHTCKSVEIYNQSKQKLKENKYRITFADFVKPVNDVPELTIVFETHTRIKTDKHLVNKPPSFHIIIESLLRRAFRLNFLHCGGGEIKDFAGWLHGTEGVDILSSRITWYDFERYSARQKSEMYLGGVKGWVKYKGELSEYMPLLRFGEFINVGKVTTMGMGKIKVEDG